MNKHFLGIFYLIILSSCFASAQGIQHSSPFIAVNVGGFASGVGGFDKVANSRMVFAFGGSLGLPASDKVYVYAQLSYFSKSDVSVTSTTYYRNGQRLATPEQVTGPISFRQWITNFGVLDRVLSTESIALEIMGGLTFSRFKADQGDLVPGRVFPGSPVETHTMGGLFAGLILEHSLGQSPFSPFLGVQYDHLWPLASSNVSNYGAINLAGGVRFHFKAHSD
jgi:hypothetical protein